MNIQTTGLFRPRAASCCSLVLCLSVRALFHESIFGVISSFVLLKFLSVPVFTSAHVLVMNVPFSADLILCSVPDIFVNCPTDVARLLLVSKIISYEFLRGLSFLKCCIFLYGSGGDYEEEEFDI